MVARPHANFPEITRSLPILMRQIAQEHSFPQPIHRCVHFCGAICNIAVVCSPQLIKPQNMPAKVKKSKPQPKRTILAAADDHPVGLWVDKELLRKHTQTTPKTIIHGSSEAAGNRYLELADIVLGTRNKKRAATK